MWEYLIFWFINLKNLLYVRVANFLELFGKYLKFSGWDSKSFLYSCWIFRFTIYYNIISWREFIHLCLIKFFNLIFLIVFSFYFLRFFDQFSEEEFARAGDLAPFEIVIPAGPVHVDDDGEDDEEHKKWVTGSFEPQLRKLGLQTHLNNGSIF